MGEALIQDIVVAAAIGLVLMVFVLVAYEGVRQKPSAKRPLDRSRQGEPYCARPEPYRQGECKWHKHELTYGIVDPPKALPANKVEEAVRASFARWADVIPSLEFSPADDPNQADIRISWKGAHGDDRSFGQRGGTLAHAIFPCASPDYSFIHMDKAEDWAFNYTGISVGAVLTHEIGHALGLGHSNSQQDVMYAQYHEQAELGPGDKRRIQELYGKQKG